MNTATRLGVYGAGLAALFGGAFAAAAAVVPQSTVSNWTQEARGHEMTTSTASHGASDGHGGHDGRGSTVPSTTDVPAPGVTIAQGGYLLSAVTAPASVDEAGTLSFQILDSHGETVTRFVPSHERKLHLIVVRTDGTQFRHVHPTLGTDGTWSLRWNWAAAGTYRVYADFVPGTDGAARTVTLTRTLEVAGQFTPASVRPTTTASVGGYTVELTGEVTPGSSSHLALSVSKDGTPVRSLQPYLGAFGHLVALREGDLAYLHVHPEGEEPGPGDLSGPEIQFAAQAPTPGRYLLYLDFKVNGEVFTAPFVVDTAGTATPQVDPFDSHEAETGTGTEADPGAVSDDGHTH